MQRGKERGVLLEHGRRTALETGVSVEQRSRESQDRCSGSAFHSHLPVPISVALTWTPPKCELATEDPCSMHLMRAPP